MLRALTATGGTDRRGFTVVWLLVAAAGLAFVLIGLGIVALTALVLLGNAWSGNDDCVGAEIGALAFGAGGLFFTALGSAAAVCGLVLGLRPRSS
jgi:hypothetical protein